MTCGFTGAGTDNQGPAATFNACPMTLKAF